jgi:hypothetical protein
MDRNQFWPMRPPCIPPAISRDERETPPISEGAAGRPSGRGRWRAQSHALIDLFFLSRGLIWQSHFVGSIGRSTIVDWSGSRQAVVRQIPLGRRPIRSRAPRMVSLTDRPSIFPLPPQNFRRPTSGGARGLHSKGKGIHTHQHQHQHQRQPCSSPCRGEAGREMDGWIRLGWYAALIAGVVRPWWSID